MATFIHVMFMLLLCSSGYRSHASAGRARHRPESSSKPMTRMGHDLARVKARTRKLARAEWAREG
eukprot:7477777-Alexandrium_andersonii.AAC.1